MSRKISVQIVGDSASLERAFKRSAASSGVLGHSLSGLATRAAGLVGSFIAVRDVVGAGVTELKEHQTAMSQTAAALKSTGGVAGVTAKHIEGLGQELSNLSGINDEVVQSAENVLLGFTNVRNVAGKNNAVFDETVHVLADLSTRLGKEMPQAATIGGRALQNPIRGMAGLSRMGVLFDDVQKKNIKTLITHGRLLDAQKIILKALETRFKGAAAAAGQTMAGQLKILRERADDVLGSLTGLAAKGLVPYVQQATRWVQNTENQRRVTDGFRRVLAQVKTAIGDVASVFRALIGPAQAVVGFLGGMKNTVKLLIALRLAFWLRGVAVALREVSLANPFTALALAATTAAIYVIENWKRVSVWFRRFWISLQEGALVAAKGVVEPFSHLPGVLGGWARAAKDSINSEFASLQEDMAALGQNAGQSFGQSFYNNAVTQMNAVGAVLATFRPPGMSDKEWKAYQKAVSNRAPTRVPGAAKRRTPRLPVTKPGALPNLATLPAGGAANKPSISDLPAWLEYRKAIAEGTKTLRDNLRVDKQIVSYFRQKLAGAKSLKDRAELVGAINQYRQDERDLTTQLKQLAVDAKTRETARRQAKQFRALGLTATGDEPTPGLGSLRKQFGTLGERIKGTFLDTPKTRAKLKSIGSVLAKAVREGMGEPVRSAIAQMFADWRDALKQGTGDVTKFQHTSTAKLIAGLGLTPDQARALRSRFAQVGYGGTVPSGGAAFAMAGGGGVYVRGDVHLHGVQDLDVFERELEKRAKSRPAQRRGARR